MTDFQIEARCCGQEVRERVSSAIRVSGRRYGGLDRLLLPAAFYRCFASQSSGRTAKLMNSGGHRNWLRLRRCQSVTPKLADQQSPRPFSWLNGVMFRKYHLLLKTQPQTRQPPRFLPNLTTVAPTMARGSRKCQQGIDSSDPPRRNGPREMHDRRSAQGDP